MSTRQLVDAITDRAKRYPGIFSSLFGSRETYRTTGGGHKDERARLRRELAEDRRAEKARAADLRREELAEKRAARAVAPKPVTRYKGTTLYKVGAPGAWAYYSSLDPDSHFDSLRDLKKVVDHFKNPASNYAQWSRAVGVLRGELDGSPRQAVRVVRSTPHARGR